MSKEFYDKYGKLVDCFSCNCIEPCSKSDSPLCSEGYVFFAKDKIADLEAKLAESENKLGQYPYKNDVIEKQYEDLKDGIKFRIENNITDDWEQNYHCIDVLCEKHKARIRDIEDGIYRIEQLKQQLAEKDKLINNYADDLEKVANENADLVFKLAEKEKQNEVQKDNIQFLYDLFVSPKGERTLKAIHQDKISFAVEKLKETKFYVDNQHFMNARYKCEKKVYADIWNFIDNQIKQLKEGK